MDRPRRILLISALFPPNVIGGAEVSAWNMAQGFRAAGWEVGVLAAAVAPSQVCADRREEGLRLWRVPNLRPYPADGFTTAPRMFKPIWHLQDHVDPRNRHLLRPVLEAFRPDLVQVHMLQGLGYNMLGEMAARDIPTTCFLHDLSLVCLRQSMFRKGHNCTGQCADCALSSRYKLGLLRRIPRLRLVSPSAGNFRRMEQVADLSGLARKVALNPNRYPPPAVPRRESAVFRVLYAGRLQPAKGVETVLAAMARLHGEGRAVRLDLAGTGPQEAALRERAAGLPFLRLHGHLPQQGLSDLMQDSDLLVVPSLWAENSPGVLIHALSQGLPALGSDVGGIPELIVAGENGLLLPPGDVAAWEAALRGLAQDGDARARLRAGAAASAARFRPELLMQRIVDLAAEAVATPGPAA